MSKQMTKEYTDRLLKLAKEVDEAYLKRKLEGANSNFYFETKLNQLIGFIQALES